MADRWAKLALNYFRHPKSRALGRDGRSLHLASICWSAQELTDGYVPAQQLPLLAAEAEVKPAVHRVLVAHGAWLVVEGGWQINDFTDWQQTRAQVEAERDKWKRQKRGQRTMSTADMRVDSTACPPDESKHESKSEIEKSSKPRLLTPLPSDGLCEAAAAAIEIHLDAKAKEPGGVRSRPGLRSTIVRVDGQRLNEWCAANPDAEPIAAAVAVLGTPDSRPFVQAMGECPRCEGVKVLDTGNGFEQCRGCWGSGQVPIGPNKNGSSYDPFTGAWMAKGVG